MEMEEVDSVIHPTSLGIAASQFYLVAQTPMQMQVGLREARKIILECLSEGYNLEDFHESSSLQRLRPLLRSHKLDEISLSWLLFTLCSTHEFDELPVRHNEEFLNEELSDQLMWGPDTRDLLAGNRKGSSYRNPEIYKDPHTKCFLLMQAYLERARLPISDYINDTKSVVENVPRLLAAMSFLAYEDRDTMGSFELVTQLSRVRQLFEARAKVDDDPLLQLPGMTPDLVRRLQDNNSSSDKGPSSLLDARSMERDKVGKWLEQLSRSSKTRGFSWEKAVAALYEIPSITLMEASVSFENSSQMSLSKVGKLILVLEIQRTEPVANQKSRRKMDALDHHPTTATGRNGDDESSSSFSHSITILVGSPHEKRMVLGHDVIRISRFGTWSVRREISFDVGGTSFFVMASSTSNLPDDSRQTTTQNPTTKKNGGIVVRLLRDEVRGLDIETWIPFVS
jgi:hypothetical protein